MKFNFFFKTLIVGILILFIASCDRDVNEIGGSIVGDSHYGLNVAYSSVVAYNQNLGAVQSNNLSVNQFGVYTNPVFGTTKASFVSQVQLATPNPTFYDQAHVVVDSVFLYVPYFATLVNTDATSGNSTYTLDSIHGANKISLSVYESNYFLRDLDASTGFQQQQKYFSNQQTDFDANHGGILLNDDNGNIFDHTITNDNSQNSEFVFSQNQIYFYQKNADGTPGYSTISERKAPGMILNLNKNFFVNKIINAPSEMLSTNNAFKNYFRGLYFKVDNAADSPTQGTLAMMNFSAGAVTIVYHDNTSATDATRVRRELTINLSGNSVNLLNNTFSNPVTSPDVANGDSDLYVKGGDGSMAVIDLFGKQDVRGYDINGGVVNLPNGVPDELDDLRNPQDGKKWLINEANLTFHIDRDAMGTTAPEPNRIYLYDLTNKRPLVDYYSDYSTSASSKYNKFIFGGIIKKESDGRGSTYKIKITNHIRNLIKYGGVGVTADSTNVRLGLVVTENINNAYSAYLANPFTSGSGTNLLQTKLFPVMSTVNPLGTILYGSNPSVPVDKRLRLEIYYTKPD